MIVLDLMLPGSDGVEVARHVRTHISRAIGPIADSATRDSLVCSRRFDDLRSGRSKRVEVTNEHGLMACVVE